MDKPPVTPFFTALARCRSVLHVERLGNCSRLHEKTPAGDGSFGLPFEAYHSPLSDANFCGSFWRLRAVEVTADGLSNYSLRDLLPFINDRTIHNFGVPLDYVGEIFPTNPPAWSLFFEMIASTAFIALVRLKPSALAKTAALSFVTFLGFRIINSLIAGRYGFDFVQGWKSVNLIGGIPRVLFGFLLGMVIYGGGG
jgi:hypothetical protein